MGRTLEKIMAALPSARRARVETETRKMLKRMNARKAKGQASEPPHRTSKGKSSATQVKRTGDRQ